MNLENILIVVIVVLALLLASALDTIGDQHQQQYCEMVDLWDRTNGELGWPAYKGECDE
jgi:hypothetical protein